MTRRAALLLLVGVVVATWLPSLDASFQFDDFNVIVGDARVQSLHAWAASMPAIRPLLRLSYALNHAVDSGPAGFRLVNVLVHAANAVLAWLLLESLGRRCGLEPARARTAAMLGALLFALHPVQTEAVTYVSGRSSSLSALFVLGSLLAWSRSFEGVNERGLRLLGLALGLAALGTKESAIALPLAMVACAALPAQDTSLRARQLRSAAATTALLLLAGAVLAVATPYGSLARHALERRDPVHGLLAEARALPWLLGQLAMPWRLESDPLLVPADGLDFAALLALGMATGALVAACVGIRRHPAASFAVLWAAAWLLPVNLVFPREDLANDRQLYLAILGPAWWMGCAAAGLAARTVARPWAARAASFAWVALLVALGALTVARNRVYADEITFWEAAVQASPGKARAWNNLGYSYAKACRDERARLAFEAAAELDPEDLRPLANLKRLRLGSLAPEERSRCAPAPTMRGPDGPAAAD